MTEKKWLLWLLEGVFMKAKHPSAQSGFSKIHFLSFVCDFGFLCVFCCCFFGCLGVFCVVFFFKGNHGRLCEMWLAALFTSKVITS